jgi:diguanylate cyclase (GGDEF)-like protein
VADDKRRVKDGRRRQDRAVSTRLLLVSAAVIVACAVGVVLQHPLVPVDGWPWLVVPMAVLISLADRNRVPVGYGTSAQVLVSATTAMQVAALVVAPTWVLLVLAVAEYVLRPWRRMVVNLALLLVPMLAAVSAMSAVGAVAGTAAPGLDPTALLAAQVLCGAVAWWLGAGLSITVLLWRVVGIPPRESPVLEPFANRAMLTQIFTGVVAGLLVRMSWWLLPFAVLQVWWLHRQLTDQGTTNPTVSDPTTGLLRYDVFRSVVYQEQARSQVTGAPLALLMLDLDRFREVNDAIGFVAGDAVLHDVARAVASNLRHHDVPSRFGGDDFLVLLTGASVAEAKLAAQRVRTAVGAVSGVVAGVDVRVSLSVGVTDLQPLESLDDALGRLDAALYEAKAPGASGIHTHPA